MASDATHILWWTAAINAAAVLVAPAVALWLQRKLDRERASQDRQLAIFRDLWVNRKRLFYISRVDALNMIAIEFYKNKAVRNAWNDLFAHYNKQHTGLSDDQLVQQREELYTTLLIEMGRVVGYEFGRVEIRDNAYSPALHNTINDMDMETRTRILDLLRSDALPVKFVSPPEQGDQSR